MAGRASRRVPDRRNCRSMPEWYETFFGPLALEFWDKAVPPSATAEEVDFLVRNLAVEPPARLLDLPCGLGRHALLLAGRGYRVTGIDIAQEAIESARGRARAVGVERGESAGGGGEIRRRRHAQPAPRRSLRRRVLSGEQLRVPLARGYETIRTERPPCRPSRWAMDHRHRHHGRVAARASAAGPAARSGWHRLQRAELLRRPVRPSEPGLRAREGRGAAGSRGELRHLHGRGAAPARLCGGMERRRRLRVARRAAVPAGRPAAVAGRRAALTAQQRSVDGRTRERSNAPASLGRRQTVRQQALTLPF